MYYSTSMENLKIREARIEDIPLILSFIKETAEYEKMLDDVTATEESLKEALFKNDRAKVIFAELDGKPMGYALYFYNFSTFTGKAGLYLEDIFVKKAARGTGIGKILFNSLVQIAKENGCITMDWACLDWNKPSIEFYKSLGSIPMDGWTGYRLTKDEMNSILSNSSC